MAAPTVAEITASRGVATGALAVAPLGTALPTDSSTALAVGYKALGYIGSGGIIPTRAITTNPVQDMNGETVYTLQTDFSRTYQVELLQTANIDVKQAIFGASNVTVTAGTPTAGTKITVQDKAQQASHVALVITTYDGTKTHRECASDAQITSVDIGPLVATNVRSYTVTYTIYKDSSGVYVYEYDNDGVFIP